MRPGQWIKNLFVFAPLLFSAKILVQADVISTVVAFMSFSFAASAVYVLNDIVDIESDRLHETKRHTRMLAAGKVQKPTAIVIIAILVVAAAVLSLAMPRVLGVIGIYLLVNIAYSFWLKHQPVLDIFCIASGFVLRVTAGAQAIHVELSAWMAVTTFSLALFLAAMKRKAELKQSAGAGRLVLQSYTPELVSMFATVSASSAVVFYSLYCLSTKPAMTITIPVVLFGIMRYWFVSDRSERSQNPSDTIFRDVQLALAAVIWLALSAYALTNSSLW
jgi:4-hydroxybenzoate polyprenyltransferase